MGPLNCFFEVLTKRDPKVLQEEFRGHRKKHSEWADTEKGVTF